MKTFRLASLQIGPRQETQLKPHKIKDRDLFDETSAVFYIYKIQFIDYHDIFYVQIFASE